MSLIDQNAFGLLFAFYDIEDAEYALEPEEFVERCELFRSLILEHLREHTLAEAMTALDLGHALYFEFEDGDQLEDPMAWLRAVARRLSDAEFASVAVLTHGGRWLDEAASSAEREAASNSPASAEREAAPNSPASAEREDAPNSPANAGPSIVRVTRPSEALRRALYADAATHGSDGDDGWGSGVFVDDEAIVALNRTFKNAPTPLLAAGAKFFRLGS